MVFLTAFTALQAYDKFWSATLIADIADNIVCYQNNTNNKDCKFITNTGGLVALYAIVPVCFTLYAVLLLVYGLSARTARELWAAHFKKLLQVRKFCRREPEIRSNSQIQLQILSTA